MNIHIYAVAEQYSEDMAYQVTKFNIYMFF